MSKQRRDADQKHKSQSGSSGELSAAPPTAAPGVSPAAVEALRGKGPAIVRMSWIGTAVFTLSATAATIWPDSLAAPSAVVAGILFCIGFVAFLWAYAIAVSRSREDLVGIGGLFFLQGSAPRSVKRHLMLALAIQTTVAVVTGSVRLYTPLAFGILAPLFGLGLAGLWAARHGAFPPRPVGWSKGRSPAGEQATPGGPGTGPGTGGDIGQNDGHGRSNDRAPDDPRLA